ncbi:MAG: 16S rRNA (uracil(1498)-N(3))-methyltransferase [Candidatus Omnitrophica bacterium]|nr:16S rRNA (uracil(1498)-N(3))-methyltransferase [Candidatus Omnitrophota bacterium]
MPHKPCFYTQQKLAPQSVAWLDEKESRHAVNVLRLKKGEAIEVFDGQGHAFEARVGDLKEGALSVFLAGEARSRELPVHITLAVSAVASDRMEFLIQKVCELGALEIWPVVTERSMVKLSEERWTKKITRWRKIAQESCKQCGRSKIPEIEKARTFDSLLGQFEKFDLVLIPTLGAENKELLPVLKESQAFRILALIGPEGDFSPREVKEACFRGARPVTLGPLVLRTETAAVVLTALLGFFFREIRS